MFFDKFSNMTMLEKFRYIFVLFLFLAIVAIFRIAYLQYLDKDRISTDDIFKRKELHAVRGSIMSHDGKLMLVTIPTYTLRWDSTLVPDSLFEKKVDSMARCLSDIYKDKSQAKYKDILKTAKKKNERYFKLGNRNINYSELQQIKNAPVFKLGKFKGGLITIENSIRKNPYGSLANRTIGNINSIGEGTGIEYTYDKILKGEGGFCTTKRTVGDNWIVANGEPAKEPVDGMDIRTTLDIYIQEACERELRYQLAQSDIFEGGTVIVMDVSTGAIRGISNLYKKKDGTFDESYNFAFSHPTEPGSTLKLASLISLIEDNKADLDTPVDAGNGVWEYKGAKITDTHRGGYGMLTLQKAFEKSSNIAFAKLVTGAYESSPDIYVSRLHNMKLVERLDLDVDGEGIASIISPDDKLWSGTTLATLGYGYGVTLTPLHTLTFYNAIANNGKMVKPHFIESFEKDGRVIQEFKPQIVSGSICSRETVKKAKTAMIGVVNNGTGTVCKDARYQIAGKTGTARMSINGRYEDPNGYKKHQASFAGYFPADDPKYSCIVVLYSGLTKANFYGGSWAAPIFKRIADKIYAVNPEWNSTSVRECESNKKTMPIINSGKAEGIDFACSSLLHKTLKKSRSGWCKYTSDSLSTTTEPIIIEKNMMPDVTSMGLKDALYLLENEGYRVTFHGHGKVYSQNPPAGTQLTKNSNITIYLK